jgi:hypothetical protein
MKAERKIYKGIEYVLVAELPQTQREQLMQTLSQDQLIKILIEGTIVSQCLQYKDYSFWFDNIYNSTTQAAIKETVSEQMTLTSAQLAFK